MKIDLKSFEKSLNDGEKLMSNQQEKITGGVSKVGPPIEGPGPPQPPTPPDPPAPSPQPEPGWAHTWF